jgi:ORF6N domain-containing protein
VAKKLVQVERIQQRILLIRGNKVIVDADLAEAYGIETRRLNEQVRRNSDRFPDDFMFQLTADEKAEVIAKCDHLQNLKFSKALPLVFTEHGAIMAAGVLNTPRAVEVSVYVVRAFVKLREMVGDHKELSGRIAQLERKMSGHDVQIVAIVDAIKKLIGPGLPPKKHQIGFQPRGKGQQPPKPLVGLSSRPGRERKA